MDLIDTSWPGHTAIVSTGVPSLELRLDRETKTGGAAEDAASFPPEAYYQGAVASCHGTQAHSPAPIPQGPDAPRSGPAAHER
ncbi:hypothetical protein NDU88_005750 [Pleurodeles waltl]|uniref:Uncharacterized protein n=1 Tax=Pleurodeles waltl TaxID=8319 RepID=A0AAV7PGB9_PLEWA|nr:hypothetical protein NDU88_005750 [Pleurodeles waltl]